MENIEYKTDSFGTEHVLIHKEDGGITSMSKTYYEEQLAARSSLTLPE